MFLGVLPPKKARLNSWLQYGDIDIIGIYLGDMPEVDAGWAWKKYNQKGFVFQIPGWRIRIPSKYPIKWSYDEENDDKRLDLGYIYMIYIYIFSIFKETHTSYPISPKHVEVMVVEDNGCFWCNGNAVTGICSALWTRWNTSFTLLLISTQQKRPIWFVDLPITLW